MLIEEFDYLCVMCYMMMFAMISSWDLFNTNKLKEGSNHYVNPNVGVRDMLRNTRYLHYSNNILISSLQSLKTCVV